VGALDPVTILAPHVDGPVVVDNDVNWAAQAERDAQGVEAPSDLAYLFLGEGVGCAIVGDGEVRRGYTGLAGEIAHLITEGVGGHAVPLIEVFGELGLRRASSTAIDVERLLSACDDVAQPAIRHALARALSGVVAAVVALTDPERIIIGGSWGPAILDDLRAAVARTARPVSLQLATVTGEPSLAGARAEALRRLRASIVASA
jgi:predicted NBD/HSP70 family sugar kinase